MSAVTDVSMGPPAFFAMSASPRRREPAIRPADALRIVAVVVGVYLLLQLLWVGRSIILVTFLAVLFGLAISAGVDRLERWRVPRGVGAALVAAAAVGTLVGIGALAAPQVRQQVGELKEKLPEALDQAERWVGRHGGEVVELLETPPDSAKGDSAGGAPTDSAGSGSRGVRPVTEQPDSAQPVSLRRGLSEQISGASGNFFAIFSSTIAIIGGMILVLFVAIYVAAEPKLYHAGLMHLFPHRSRERAGEVLSEVAVMLRRWLVTQLVAMVVIGAVTTVVLLLLGVRGAVALGILAGLLEFVPYVGPIIAAVPAIAMGFLSGPEVALSVAIAYTLIQQAENHLLMPLLMKKGLDLPPVVTIIAQALMGVVFGFLGLLVAMPLVGAVMVLVKMLYVQDVVGDDVPLPGDSHDA